MTKRENLLRTLNGEKTEQMPVTPHWWGLYKFEMAGMLTDYTKEQEAWNTGGEALARIDAAFFETFQPDMFHLTAGPSRTTESDAIRREKQRLVDAVRTLDSLSAIDEYVDACYPDKQEILKSGVFDHIRILSRTYGGEVLLVLNEGNPVCEVLDPHGCVGFENGLIALKEQPDALAYLLRKCYAATLPRIEALKKAGGDGYIGSETYCSADLISPQTYRDVIFEAQQAFYTAVGKMGVVPITYFLGDVNPLLDSLCDLGAKALMVEESKKVIHLDIGTIYRKLEGRMALFGNLDSVYTLQLGTPEQVARETRKQMQVCDQGGFIMANGCPVSFTTPPENVHAMIRTVRNL